LAKAKILNYFKQVAVEEQEVEKRLQSSLSMINKVKKEDLGEADTYKPFSSIY
jgi:hypothetical protein